MKVQVITAMDADKTTVGNVETKTLTKSERLAFALKKAGLFWGIGIACIFIPVFHFVLVPTAILVGIFAFYRELGLAQQITQGTLICPVCQKSLEVNQAPFEWPKRMDCQTCQTRVLIEESKS